MRDGEDGDQQDGEKDHDRGSEAIDDGEKAEEEKKYDEEANAVREGGGDCGGDSGRKHHGEQVIRGGEAGDDRAGKEEDLEEAKKAKAKYEEQQRLAAEAAKKGWEEACGPRRCGTGGTGTSGEVVRVGGERKLLRGPLRGRVVVFGGLGGWYDRGSTRR